MKVILDIKEDNRTPFLMETLRSLRSIKVVKEVNEKNKSQQIADLAEAFSNVKSHEEGKIKLKSAKVLINEL